MKWLSKLHVNSKQDKVECQRYLVKLYWGEFFCRFYFCYFNLELFYLAVLKYNPTETLYCLLAGRHKLIKKIIILISLIGFLFQMKLQMNQKISNSGSEVLRSSSTFQSACTYLYVRVYIYLCTFGRGGILHWKALKRRFCKCNFHWS